MRDNEELKALSFLNPENLVTRFDAAPIENGTPNEYADAQYKKGLDLGNKYGKVSIATNDTWSAGNASSYEKLGHARNTADLMRGFLDSNAQITVYRDGDIGGIETTIIRKSQIGLENDDQAKAMKQFKELYPEANVIPMIDLVHSKVSLSSQVSNILNNKYHLYDFEESHGKAMVSKDEKYVLVYPTSLIHDLKVRQEIINQIDGVEKNAAVIEKTSLSEFNYKARDQENTVTVDGKTYHAFIEPKAYHQDQQRVFYVKDENLDNNLKNKQKI